MNREELELLQNIEKCNKRLYDSWDLKVNNKLFHMDIKNNLNEIIVHHYLVNQMRLTNSYEAKTTLREIEYKTNLGLQQVRTAIQKLEQMGIIEVTKGRGKAPSIYKYIEQ